MVFVGIMISSMTACKCWFGKDSSNLPDSSTEENSSGTEWVESGYNIVTNGTTKYTLVIPQNNESNWFAAEEIRDFVRQATGADLSISYDTEYNANNKAYISLGRTSLLAAENYDIDYDALNYDGFIMKTEGESLYIDGYRNSGVLNGAYEFLESFVGIKFLTEECTYVPDVDNVPLYAVDILDSPAFITRDTFAKANMSNKLFAARMRLNSKYGSTPEIYGENGQNAYYASDGHTMEELIPYEQYGTEHPDWFCHNGKEYCYTNGITENDEYDETDTDSLVSTLIEICKEKILAKPNALYFMIGQPDNGLWDTSAEATASSERNGGKSGTLMVFINVIAEQIEKWMQEENIDQDVVFVTFAYWKTIYAPVKQDANGSYVPYNENVKARDNVAIKIAHMTCSYHSLYDTSCSENVTASTHFKQWSAITDTILVWDYNTNFTAHFYWYPNFNSIVKNLEFYREYGVVEVMTQGAPHVSNYYQAHLETYLYSKLMWNPDQDVNVLIDEFNYYYFGEESSAVVDNFVKLMLYHYATLDSVDTPYHNELYANKDFKDFKWYPKGFLEQAYDLINNEITAVQKRENLSNSERVELRLRLESVLLHPAYMILDNYDAYYDPNTKKSFAEKFFDLCGDLGIEYYGEGLSIASLKTTYGVN